MAIPARPPTTPPTTELVVGSRPPPPDEPDSVEVLVGRTVRVAPAPPTPTPAAPVPSPLPKTVMVGTSVVEVRRVDDESDVVVMLNEKLVLE